MTNRTTTYAIALNCQNEPGMEASSRHGLEGLKMHILAILAAIAAGAAVWYWRVRAMRDAGSEIADAVWRARGAIARHNFRNKAEGSVLTSVDDPVLAAAIFLFALANESGIDDRVAAEIRRQLSTIANPHDLDEVMAYAAWATRSVIDARDCVRRFKQLWRDNLTLNERRHLVAMAVAVRGAAPGAAAAQKLAIEMLQTALAH